MEQAIRAAGMADTAIDPTADPSRDVELHPSDPRLTRNPSRASLPLSHRRSVSTFARSRPNSAAGARSQLDEGALDGTDGGAQDEDEIPWGPQHPCFPHPNPHVPLSSPLYESTRIIRIKRDWMVAGDLGPAFSNVYPEILDPMLSEERFRELITKLNSTLLSAFSPLSARSYIDTVMGVLTGWLWDDLGFAGIKRSMKQLESWIEAWNRDYGTPEGIAIIPLRRTAYTCLDIQIPDPQISVEGEATADDNEMSTNRGSVQSRPQTRSPRTPGGARRQRQAGLRDDVEYGAYPVVPPIPDRYLEEHMRDSMKSRTDGGHVANGAA